jgi:hypothetical protein
MKLILDLRSSEIIEHLKEALPVNGFLLLMVCVSEFQNSMIYISKDIALIFTASTSVITIMTDEQTKMHCGLPFLQYKNTYKYFACV